MSEITAKLSYYRIAPRKVRLVADLIRGKNTKAAVAQLTFLNKRSSPMMLKLLKSAISNAKNNAKIDVENTDLFVKTITVDDGPSYKRWRPVWRGMAHPFKRRTSNITIVLSERTQK